MSPAACRVLAVLALATVPLHAAPPGAALWSFDTGG